MTTLTPWPPALKGSAAEVYIEQYRAGGTDAQAFAAALARLGPNGGVIRLQAGRVYSPTTTVALPSFTTLDLNGATLKPDVPTATSFVTNVNTVTGDSRITIANGTIDGSLLAGDQAAGGLLFVNVDDFTLANVLVQDMPVSALELRGCRRHHIDERCRFERIGTAEKIDTGVHIGSAVIVQDSIDGETYGHYADVWQIPVFLWAVNGEVYGNHTDITIARAFDNGYRLQPDNGQPWDAVHHNTAIVRADRVRIDAVRFNGFDNTVLYADLKGLTDTAVTTNGSAVLTGLADAEAWSEGDPVQGAAGIQTDAVVASIDGPTQLTMSLPATADGVTAIYTSQAGIKSVGGTRLTVRQADVDGIPNAIYWRVDGGYYGPFDGHTETLRLGELTIRNSLSPLQVVRIVGTEVLEGFEIDGLEIDGVATSDTSHGVAINDVAGLRISGFDIHDCARAGISLAGCSAVRLTRGTTRNNQRVAANYAGIYLSACAGVTVTSSVESYDDRAAGAKTQEYGIRCVNTCSKLKILAPYLGLNAGGVDQTNKLGTFLADAGTTSEIIRLEQGAGGTLLIPSAVTTIDTTGPLTTRGGNVAIGAATNSTVRSSKLSADATARFIQATDGKLTWGDGTNPVDVNLARTAAQRIGTGQQFQAVDGLATKYLSAAGKTTVVDGDFAVTPLNGTIAIHRDTTAGKTYVSVRANGSWTVIAGPL